MVLLLIAGIPLTMMLAATWLWYFVVRGDLDLVGCWAPLIAALWCSRRGSWMTWRCWIEGLVFKYADLEPKWAMLVPGSAASVMPPARRACI